ncbi:MAG: tripartite tricarboxylate transporter TctB family protein [Candidatus Methylomirabilales bacterium]
MTDRSHDTVAGVLIAGLCVAYLQGARALESPLVTDPLGPSAFPVLLGGAGLILAAALMAQGWRREAARAAGTPLRRYLKPLLLFALLLAYALCLAPVGYLITTLAFVAASLLLLGEPAWRAAVIAVGFSGGFYLLFVKVLKISLPAGIL